MTTTPLMTVPAQRPPLDGLASRLRGRLLPGGSQECARLSTPWNVAVPVHPYAVVAAADAGDVVEAVRYAGRSGLEVLVQNTGHGAWQSGEGALLVQTGRLDECTVHPDGWARVGAGVRWQRVLEAAAPFGLAPLAGSAPDVGVVGYTTGGGHGPLARTYGLASDRVRAFEVVTGDGELRRVTPTEHPDLFWGLRGGKGALGVVTAVEFDLLPLAGFYGGSVFFDGADAETVLHAWQQWCDGLPGEATTSLALLRLPPLPGVPEPLAGRLTVAVRFAWAGDAASGARVLAGLRGCAPVLLDGVGELPYAALGQVHLDPVDPLPATEAHTLLTELPPEALDALLPLVGPDAPAGPGQLLVEIRQLGGATAREPEHPSAFCARSAPYSLLAVGIAAPPVVEAVREHARQVLAALAPWDSGRQLPNFAGGADAATMRRFYDAPTLARLAQLAERYDPQRVIGLARGLRTP
ncbi:MAG TPA: FAD-binding protein [Mycobacteriales bacterium]|nr:FAD-binding protein [Mycobacteriales bacterium]